VIRTTRFKMLVLFLTGYTGYSGYKHNNINSFNHLPCSHCRFVL
jgi:hypothetical protein